MDIDPDLSEFSNRCRLFPLPEVVLFPHAVLPLHIFEPRYRQMTEDALSSDLLVTMVQIQPLHPEAQWTEPVPIMDVGCLGKIVQLERLGDGRFNFLLLGCKRVRLIREIPTPKLYRVAEARVLDDQGCDLPLQSLRDEVLDLFLQLLQRTQERDLDPSRLLGPEVGLGVLSDLIAGALVLPPLVKQALLAETRVDRRGETLRTILRMSLAQGEPWRDFPPTFSLN
jgi:Lon protease-like protein